MAGFDSKEEMQKVIDKWVQLLENDEETAKKCEGLNCTMQFEMTDLDLVFYTNFVDGKVTAGVGEDDPEAMVFLEMDSETFDGMMTGEIDGASAAMSGDMTFSGDMSAAMGLQALQDDLSRMYLKAKQEKNYNAQQNFAAHQEILVMYD